MSSGYVEFPEVCIDSPIVLRNPKWVVGVTCIHSDFAAFPIEFNTCDQSPVSKELNAYSQASLVREDSGVIHTHSLVIITDIQVTCWSGLRGMNTDFRCENDGCLSFCTCNEYK